MRILVTDDSEANRLLATSILERDGHIVISASDGQKALSECDGVKFDLILLDILMPGMNGIKTLRRLRHSNGRNAHTPVFALTAYCSASDRRQYRQAGFDYVLPKPLRQMDVENAWNCYKNKKPTTDYKDSLIHNNLSIHNLIIDPDHWNQIRDHATKNELSSILQKFWKTALECIKTIQDNKLLASQSVSINLSHLRKASHKLKGASASLGLRRLEYFSSELQNAPPETIPILANDLTKCAMESRKAQIKSLNHIDA